ncbi:MAG: ATP-binding cassette domain-containing protein [Abitibacteriaceae bacterium]|nr:ATP-binding cassette domain-containing protein [Abditibacteriaceae bacterium]
MDSAPHDTLIQFREVSYTPPGGVAPILETLSIEIQQGATLALLGESGSGKTTTLRLINSLLLPTRGEVMVDGKSTQAWNAMQLRRKVGYVIQEGGLFPHLTASQNVLLMARHLARPADAMQRRLEELCDLTHFPPDALNRYPSELSGGQRQRVGLMRALMLDPDILLLDEPLAALDPMVRASLQTDLKEIFQRLHKTVVLVTHDMAEAGYLADRIVLLRNGKMVQQGTLEELREQPADPFVSAFISAQRSLVQL